MSIDNSWTITDVAKGACPMCAELGLSGDLYLNYKGGKRYRCIQKGHYFRSEDDPATAPFYYGVRSSMVEQSAHNREDVGSSPAGPTEVQVSFW